jgi:hypothetical protein
LRANTLAEHALGRYEHLATAQVVLGSRLTAFVTYDRRLLLAGANLGMPVASPGAATREP